MILKGLQVAVGWVKVKAESVDLPNWAVTIVVIVLSFMLAMDRSGQSLFWAEKQSDQLSEIKGSVDGMTEYLVSHELRIRALEQWRMEASKK